jgi:hypothetical protein
VGKSTGDGLNASPSIAHQGGSGAIQPCQPFPGILNFGEAGAASFQR